MEHDSKSFMGARSQSARLFGAVSLPRRALN
jgi:hypothetical protein